MKLTKESLIHTADQSRLILSEDELESYGKELNDILAFTEKIKDINTDGVKPTTIGNMNSNIMREDNPVKWDKREAALENAPDHDGEHFKVPAIMD